MAVEGAEPTAFVTFQIESQNIRNRERDLMHENSKLGRNKRKSDDILHYSAFKRKKLDRVGDRSRFDTDSVNWQDERETGGLNAILTSLQSSPCTRLY